jgi:quercetin dioxygenase-like cupin family protein
MMNYEKVTTNYVDAESYPWFPFVPYTDKAFVKLLKVEPVSGTFVTLLRAPGDLVLPKHHHCGTVMVYTVKGQWKYLEHDWTAVKGSFVYETAATSHTPVGVGSDEIITLNIQVGDSLFMDDKDNILAVENWKTVLKRYLDFCAANGMTPVDVSSFAE